MTSASWRVIFRQSTAPEEPADLIDLWADLTASELKKCTAVAPYTWVQVGGGGGVSDPHGAGQHSDVTRELFIGANENYASIVGPIEYAAPLYVTKLTDATTNKIALNFKVPDDFVSFISVKLVWLAVAASGNMRWATNASYRASGESYSTHNDFPPPGVTATGGASILNVQEPANALTLSNLALGDYVSIEATRTGGHADDTLNDNAWAYGILFTYTAHQ